MSQTINLNILPNYSQVSGLYFSQNDVGRTATINLIDDNGVPYEIPSGATVKIQATKPSGLGFSEACTYEDNIVTVTCSATMTDELGKFPCEIEVLSGSVVLGSANFLFCVERNPHPNGTTDGTAESVLNDITVAFNNAMENIENAGGLTVDIKEALLACFRNVAWIGDDGQDYYDALADELFAVTGITLNSSTLLFNSLGGTQQLTASLIPSTSTATVTWSSSDPTVASVSSSGLVTSVANGSATITASVGSVSATCSVTVSVATVTSISAVLNASGHTFYVGDPVDDIKPYLTVTATYSDSTTQTVPSGSYTLSGTLSQVGANTITVSYESVTTTVSVTCAAAELSYISAVYTQSGTVYDTDSLDSLKADLVVTATYSDSSTSTVASTDYTLSGTLAAGTSTITVTYLEKTTTFNVTVSADLVPDGQYTFDEIIRGQYIDDNGDIQSATQSSGYFGDYVPISTNSYNVVWTNKPSNLSLINWRISEYDSNKAFLQQEHFEAYSLGSRYSVLTPYNSSARYVRIGWYMESTTFVPTIDFYNVKRMPMTVGNIDPSTGQDTGGTATRIRSDYISATGTMSFSNCPFASAWETGGGYAFRCYDSSKNFIGSLTNNGGLFNTDISNEALPSGTEYVRIFLHRKENYSFESGWGETVINYVVLNGTKYWMTEA